MGESPKFERPTTLEEEHELTLERSNYLIEQLGIDLLTGLKNRKSFEDELERSLKTISTGTEGHHRSGGEPLRELSLLFIDLDNFKQVNDKLGHQAGDDVLKRVAGILTNSIRESDAVARFGGDEFYVLLPRANEHHAMSIAEKIRTNLMKDSELNELGVTASIGIRSVNASNTTDQKTLINHADAAAYIAKHNGKNQIETHHSI